MDTAIRHFYARLKFLIVRYRRLLILGIAALIGTDIMGMAIPWLIKDGLDAALQSGQGSSSLPKYTLLILVAALLQGVFRYLWRVNIHGFSRRAECDLRDLAFSHLQKLPLAYFRHTRTGDLMSRLTNDMQAVRELLGFGSLAVVDSILVIVASLSLMIAIDPWLTLFSLMAMPLISFTVRFFGRRIFSLSHEVQQQLSRLSAYVQENLTGIRVVQAYAQEENQVSGFNALSFEYLTKNLRLSILWGIFWPLIRVFSGIAAAVVLWLGGRQVLLGTMTLGEFVAFNGYLAMLTWPLMALGHVVNRYQRGAAALSRVLEIMDTPVAPQYRENRSESPIASVRGAIELRDLTFSYEEGQPPVLKGISLAIPAGRTCGIIGEVGSGKSTLVSLLLRLYQPPNGAILIDGLDIKEFPHRVLTENIGFVSQDIFLFSGTIRENILFGQGDSDNDALEAAAGIARILPDIRELSRQFDTPLGERGVRLSGGQRQRTALARAIIKDPPILVLDDAFSSVDAQTEVEILSQLKRFTEKRTTILISHRIWTVRGADLILYMRDGEIVERGTNEELLARKGAYYRLFQKQQLAREVEEFSRGRERA